MHLRIGRDSSNDLVVADPLASRFHAQIDLNGAASIRDLASFRGTFVAGERIQMPRSLRPSDQVTIGNQTYEWTGSELRDAPAPTSDLEAWALTVVVKGKTLLDDVSFRLPSGSLTAIIGPSGAGKSTLMGALTGLRSASSGRVTWQGRDLYAHYDEMRQNIGFVPQADIQHPQLQVRQALSFSAELRLPPDTSDSERDRRVGEVAGQLQLSERMDNRIGTELSGGQRKRVSIATELITAPPLLFLDEPTSGLDPGMDVEVMRQLRALADAGRVVVVVTHSVLALDMCDSVAALAPGGRLSYFGPPAGLLRHFSRATYPEVFHALEVAERTATHYEPGFESSAIPSAPRPADSAPAPRTGDSTFRLKLPAREISKRQLTTLINRTVAVVAADRLLLGMLLAMPLVLGILSRIVPGDAGLSLLQSPLAPDGGLDAEEAAKRITLLVVSAALMGTALTIRDLVGERPIFQREYSVGLSEDIYFASKLIVFGSLALAQGVLTTLIATMGMPGPDFGGAIGLGRVELAFVIGLLTLVMGVTGLLISALVGSSEQTMPALVAVVMSQLVLSGALVTVNGRPLLEQLAWLAPGRWAYAANASTIAVQRPLLARGLDRDWIAIHTTSHWLMDVAFLLACLVVLAWASLIAVRRSARTSS